MNLNELLSLTKLGNLFQIIALVFIVLAIMLLSSKIFIDKKINTLRDMLYHNKDVENRQLIASLESRIAIQAEKLEEQRLLLEDIPENQTQRTVGKSDINKNIPEIQARVIPEHVFEELKQRLSQFDSDSVEIICVRDDHESFALASQLKTIFKSAGWIVDGVHQSVFTHDKGGLVFIIKDVTEKPRVMDLLAFFNSLDINSVGGINKNQKGGLHVIVGANKP